MATSDEVAALMAMELANLDFASTAKVRGADEVSPASLVLRRGNIDNYMNNANTNHVPGKSTLSPFSLTCRVHAMLTASIRQRVLFTLPHHRQRTPILHYHLAMSIPIVRKMSQISIVLISHVKA